MPLCQVLELVLAMEVALQLQTEGEAAAASVKWLRGWSCSVHFSDDAARAAQLSRLYARRDALAAQIKEAKDAAAKADK